MNLFTSIEKYARETPDKTTIVFSDERISYDLFLQNVNALGKI